MLLDCMVFALMVLLATIATKALSAMHILKAMDLKLHLLTDDSSVW